MSSRSASGSESNRPGRRPSAPTTDSDDSDGDDGDDGDAGGGEQQQEAQAAAPAPMEQDTGTITVKAEEVEEDDEEDEDDDDDDDVENAAGDDAHDAKEDIAMIDDGEGNAGAQGDTTATHGKTPHIRFTFGAASRKNKQAVQTAAAGSKEDTGANKDGQTTNKNGKRRDNGPAQENDSEVDELEDETAATGRKDGKNTEGDARSRKKRRLHAGEADQSTVRSSARLHRPPPLEPSAGPPMQLGSSTAHPGRPGPLTPLSAVLAGRSHHPQVVSPAVSGFPFHAADKPTMESVRHAMQIKEAQRSLIAKRKHGEAPLTVESPGIGPPPSAGWAPSPSVLGSGTAQTGASGGSIGSRRGEEAKMKTQRLRVHTEASSRASGLQSAPAGQVRHNLVVTGNSDDDDDNESDTEDAHAAPTTSALSFTNGTVGTYKPPQPIIASGSQPRPVPLPNGQPGPYPYQAGQGGSQTGSGHLSSLNGYNPPAASGHGGGPPIAGILGPPPGMRKPVREYLGRPPAEHHDLHAPHPMQMPPPSSTSGRAPTMLGGAYPTRIDHERGPPMAFPPGAMAPPPPAVRGNNREGGRRAFLEHFSIFYDALVDSTQLRGDLAQKVQKANELIAAQEEQLSRLRSVRREYEKALGDLRMRSQAPATSGSRSIEEVGRLAALENEVHGMRETMRAFTAQNRDGPRDVAAQASDEDQQMGGSD